VNRFVLITYFPEMYQIPYSVALLDMLSIRLCGVHLPSAISGSAQNLFLYSMNKNKTVWKVTEPLWMNIYWYIFCYVPEKDVCFLPLFYPVFSEMQRMCFIGYWYCGTYCSVHMEKCSKENQILKCMNLSSEDSHQQSA
jgi:hypothetical protein